MFNSFNFNEVLLWVVVAFLMLLFFDQLFNFLDFLKYVFEPLFKLRRGAVMMMFAAGCSPTAAFPCS